VGFDWPSPAEVLDKIEEEIAELRAELCPGTTGRSAARSALPEPTAAPNAVAPSEASPGAAHATPDTARVADELGDLLFSLAQLARKLGIDPEATLRASNRKFRRRFDALEDGARREGHDLASLGLAALEARWQAVKAAERGLTPPSSPTASRSSSR
jgi:ATP diphosphatase